MPMASIAFWRFGPSTAVIAMASTSEGNASSASMARMITLSIQLPPQYPATSPSRVPIIIAIDVEMIPTWSEIWPP